MPAQNIFRWRDGRGWLVFSSEAQPDSEVRGLALGRAAADGAVACVALSRDPAAADRLLDDVEDLGAPSGYIVDVFSEDDPTLRDRLGEAGVIIIATDFSAEGVRSTLTGAAVEGMEAAFSNGAIVLVEGAAASAFGTWIFRGDGTVGQGFDWLTNSVVLTDASGVAEQAREIFMQERESIGIAVGPRSAIAFGPDGEIETWGARDVTVALAAQFHER